MVVQMLPPCVATWMHNLSKRNHFGKDQKFSEIDRLTKVFTLMQLGQRLVTFVMEFLLTVKLVEQRYACFEVG